jgi:hypothetical protein
VGGLGGMLAAGPPGAVAGAVVGAGGQRVADESYLGDPRRWAQYADLAKKGVAERTRGSGGRGVAFVEESDWVNDRDAKTRPALEAFLGEPCPGRVGICGSGGGLRAATALAGFLAEAHQCGLLNATTYLSGVSGSCWTLAALYAEDTFAPSVFPEILRKRVHKDLRAPDSAWLGGSVSAPDLFVFPRFAARCRDGHDVGIVDVWGAHLAATLLPPPSQGGFGLAAFRRRLVRGAAPLPLLTAVEPVQVGPEWSSKNCCERCGDSFSFTSARHHCRACGVSVCDACCPGFGAATLAEALARMRSTDVDFEAKVWARPLGDVVRRCGRCVAAGTEAPDERTAWRWWELGPYQVGHIGGRKIDACAFGRRLHEPPCAATGGEPVGALLGVVGSAFCATLEKVEGCGKGGYMSAAAKYLASSHGDPGASLVEPATFHAGGATVRLADAGFCHNLGWLPLLQRRCEVIFSIDASMHALAGDTFDPSYELGRARKAAERLGVDLPPIDIEAYTTQPVSFHTNDRTLLICLPLVGFEDDAWCPLRTAHAGGFCSNAGASYEPDDFDRLSGFMRSRLRVALPQIKRRIAVHLRATF